jgi:predicted DNA-binding transcriptional regulator
LRGVLAEVFEKDWVDFMMSVVPTPLAFFEVEKELFLPDGAEF